MDEARFTAMDYTPWMHNKNIQDKKKLQDLP
jgi:serine carboxypeptidase-like clade 1